MKEVSGGRRRAYLVVLLVGALMALSVSGASASAPEERVVKGEAGDDSTASFDGREINLAKGWEDARACLVDPGISTTTECFASEAELEAFVAKAGGSRAEAASSSCSSYVRLYDGMSYTGSSLWLSTRWSWINLSTYGFNQRTSSFKIGACSAYFADYSNGGGAWYPTWRTQAYDVGSSMTSGWNNDVSSIYIT